MRTLPISKVTITEHSPPAAVLIGADEWESIQQALFWLSPPRIRETIAEAALDITTGRTLGKDDVRAEFGDPKHDSSVRPVSQARSVDKSRTGPTETSITNLPDG